MNTNKYQVWEGEMEANELEENAVSFFSLFFSALLGIVLFIVLIAKTFFQAAFGLKLSAKRRNADAMKTSDLNMSIS